jgi:dihydrofolate reductase
LKTSKNIVFIAKSLDGYIADKNGEIDWLHSVPNPNHIDMGFHSLMDEVDAIVMGRTTYEIVCGFGGEWPYAKHVFVLSTQLKDIPEKLIDKVSILRGTPKEVLQSINSKGYHVLYIDGGRTIQAFLKEDLIDELRITTIPILLGGGFSLFGALEKPLKFDHIKSEVFLNQVVQDWYKRAK